MRRAIILTATVACLSVGLSGVAVAQESRDRDSGRMDRMDRMERMERMDRGGSDRGGSDRDRADKSHRDHGGYGDRDGRGRYADRRDDGDDDDDGDHDHERMMRMHERMMERMGAGMGAGMGGGSREGGMRGGLGGPRQNPGFVFRSGDMQIIVRCGAGETMKSCVEATTTLMDRARSAATPGGAPGTGGPASTAP